MARRIRRSALIAGAAAFLSAQAAYAAPALPPSSLDPLVSLSVLATGASRAAVCAGSTAAVAGAAAGMQSPAPGCVLPVTAPPPAVAAEAAPPPVVAPPPPVGSGIGVLPLLLGLAALAGVAVLIASSDDDDNGDLIPVSPA